MTKTKIAIIDDREDARGLVASVVGDAISNLGVAEEWAVIESSPLSNAREYLNWIEKENVGIVLLDERLGEVPNMDNQVVDYTGSQLVDLLRKQYKDLPIYGVTAYPADDALQQYFALFDGVVERNDFTAKAALYVERFLRTYRSFLEENEEELTELSKISKKIALGTASRSDKNRAKAIQQNLEIPVTSVSMGDRKEWLDEYEKVLMDFKETQKEASKFLKKKSKKKKK